MRFIGSKASLLANIENVVNTSSDCSGGVFCDIFSGTACVAEHFKNDYQIISNDSLYFSYVIQKAIIENNAIPTFSKLEEIGISDPISFLEDTRIETFSYTDEKYFISKYYSPHDDCERMYFTNKNAVRIDFIRNTIEAWKRLDLLDSYEYYYLIACLIENVPSVSNITGTYGAYLKRWDKRCYKNLELARLPVINNGKSNTSFNEDGLKLIKNIEGDILYIDPPYNQRQYAPNYHILETIALYDHPDISGVTGIRPYKEQKSPFCVRSEAGEALESLVSEARFEHIILSYNSEGILGKDEIAERLKKVGVPSSYKEYEIPYRQYKSKRTSSDSTLCEYLFYIRKPSVYKKYTSFKNSKKSPPYTVQRAKYIKSPTNYIGGKHKILPQILPLFPKSIGTFVDLFAGGCNVAINIQADRIICNDINSIIMDIFKYFQENPVNSVLSEIDSIIQKYDLSKTNRAGFEALRREYNQSRRAIDLYVLSCYSFNYQFRFNAAHEYNNPFGKDRSQFSEQMRNNLITFMEALHNKQLSFSSVDFMEIDLSRLTAEDFVYCDPPYLITTGSYNDGNRGFKDWNEKEEKALYSLLEQLDHQGVRFALSNVIEHKGKTNQILKNWASKYKIIEIERDYSNSSYNTAAGESREVLIINY